MKVSKLGTSYGRQVNRTMLSEPNLNKFQPIQIDASLSARAREAIRTGILSGELAAGTLHSVTALADLFGISRTPVREALIDLSKHGMVRFERNRGVRILQPSVHDLEEIVEIRLLLEPPATYRAVSKITVETLDQLERELAAMATTSEVSDFVGFMQHDRRFHSLILGRSGNERLHDFIDQLRDLVVSRGNSTLGASRSAKEIVAEHRTILNHIADGNAPAAAAAMYDHIARTGQLLIAQEGGSSDPLDFTLSYRVEASIPTAGA